VDVYESGTDIPNPFHVFQAVELIRAVWPDHVWFHFDGFLHDRGKIPCIISEWQRGVVGGTFLLGCKSSDRMSFGRCVGELSQTSHFSSWTW